MAFYDTIFENAEPLLFDGLGETLTYYPVDGDPRSIVCLVDRNGLTPDNPNGIDTLETVDVCALDDAITGIADKTWQIGDRIRFSDDPEDEFYSFKGEHRSRTNSSGWLVFQKKVNVREGGKLMR